MKKIILTQRKHGLNARLQALPHYDVGGRAAAVPATRLKTQVSFESSSQSYLWVTDRGRSRLIKH